MADSPEEIRKHIPTYYKIFAALIVGTILTVAVAKASLGVAAAVLVALIIATVKGSLVAGFFMHLLGEKKIIIWILILTGALFIPLIFLPLLTEGDHPGRSIAPPVASMVGDDHGGGDEGDH